ncbi:uncharacterized protein LOC122500461 [Leptopilina heterotoma]|uniref:uncharacterized protein LOC122500461 n=1 Tax=Leptopilina heterotoma TaxID=63436 RepID=UPI001CA9174B|nr:uncharacterized protein LOC122500461 [Leptopilina heterotoma]
MDESDFDVTGTPPEISVAASSVVTNLLPPKSKEKYELYFNEMAKTKQPSTLWSQYSMLKSTLSVKNNININSYQKLIAFLKRKSNGFKSKKSNTLTAQEVEKFLNEAPDETYLSLKVALIMGISGACRTDELLNIMIGDVESQEDILLIKIPNTKTNVSRSFTIEGNFRDIVEKYKNLRVQNTSSTRFFKIFEMENAHHRLLAKINLLTCKKQLPNF